MADVDERDLEMAIADWEDAPPDPDYKLILRAEEGS
jgi:hypothetical protein